MKKEELTLKEYLQLFLKSIQKRDYKTAFEYYLKLSELDDKEHENDFNLFIYLLNIITEIPFNYQEYAKYMRDSDIKVLSSNKKYNSEYNKIRESIIKKRFSLAMNQLNDYIFKYNKKTIYDEITRTLLLQINSAELIERNRIKKLFAEKDYEEIVKELEKKDRRCKLSSYEEYVLLLSKKYIDINESQKIPEIRVLPNMNLLDAIRTNNFNIALEMNRDYNKKFNIKDEKSLIIAILEDINSLIESLKKETKPSYSPLINEIIKNLQEKEIDKVIENLYSFLNSIDKIDYEFLLIDLMKISLIEKDFSFFQIRKILISLSDDNYVFNKNKYLDKFYQKLREGKKDEASIYLNVLSKGNQFLDEKVNIEELSKVLNGTREIPKFNTNTEEDIEAIKTQTSDKFYIDKKIEELKDNRGIILLKPMNDKRINHILYLLDSIKEVSPFVIEYNHKKQIVLRLKNNNKGVDINNIAIIGNAAFKENDFKKCRNAYFEIIEMEEEPKAYTYYKIATTYMIQRKIEKAIEYLKVAISLARKEKNINEEEHYTNLLFKLTGELSTIDEKRYIKYEDSKFDFNDINNYYIINHFDVINHRITKSGKDVETACHEFGLSKDQIDVIKLLYAREFYIQGNIVKGDQFLISVEKDKDKSKMVKTILKEIKENRKFYQNRKRDKDKKLSYSLRPNN